MRITSCRSKRLSRLITSAALCVLAHSPLEAQEVIVPYTAEQLAQVQQNLSPRFVPKSDKILYLNDATGSLELYQISSTGTPRQISSLHQRIHELCVSPDGSYALFTADSGGNERFDVFRYDIRSDSVTQLTKTPDISEGRLRISPDGTRLAFDADPDVQFRPQVFVLDLHTTLRTQLTMGDIPAWQPVWSHDGKIIAAFRGVNLERQLLIVKLSQGTVDSVKPPKGRHILVPLDFSPDDRMILCRIINDSGFSQLSVFDFQTKAIHLIGPQTWDVTEAVWNSKAGILFSRNVSGQIGLYRLRSPKSETEELVPPSGVISGMDVTEEGSKVVYAKEDGTKPKEIFSVDLATRKIEQLTYSMPTGVDSKRLADSEPFAIKSFDGTAIQGFAYKPSGSYNPPYPTVTLVHGGPELQDIDNFEPFTQALAQAGFMVLRVNYRGSEGYGRSFRTLNHKDWGGGDRKDIRAALEHYISVGQADRSRIGIAGGSFGGYLTLMALVRDADFYAAGVDLFGMPDLVADYEMCKDRWGLWYEEHMGNPYTDSALFVDRSPIHMLRQLTAPLLVFHGANDTNVPRKQSDVVVETLRSMGRSVGYYIYPDEGHVFTRRPNIIDSMQRIVSFFQQHIGTGRR